MTTYTIRNLRGLHRQTVPESHYNAGVRYGESIILAAFAREIVAIYYSMMAARRYAFGSAEMRGRADAYRVVLLDLIRVHRALRGGHVR